MLGIGTPADRLGPAESPNPWPGSTGLAPGVESGLVLAPYNRPDLLEAVFEQHAADLAAVICEPIYYNAGCILPSAEFLEALVRLTRRHQVLLVFDEVLSAFRMGPGGAQQYLGITPDLCTLGKALGGGFPLSAFGGRAEIMHRLMPTGDCQHSGTYNAHPASIAAGLAAVRVYNEPGFYDHLHQVAQRLYGGLQATFDRHGLPGRVEGLGARFGIYFGLDRRATSYRDAVRHDREQMLRFIAAAIAEGVYLHDYGGGACHHGFCHAWSLDDVDQALGRLDRAAARVASFGSS
jgi:glutamate-1-semialdehyde 2,1-aminomutase